MSRDVDRLDLCDHDCFERCVGYKATSFRALHFFLSGCERQLVNHVIALAIAHPAAQLKSGQTSANSEIAAYRNARDPAKQAGRIRRGSVSAPRRSPLFADRAFHAIVCIFLKTRCDGDIHQCD